MAILGLEGVGPGNWVYCAGPAFQPCVIWLEGEEPSDPIEAPLAAKEGKEAPRRQVRNRSARGHRYTPNKGSNR